MYRKILSVLLCLLFVFSLTVVASAEKPDVSAESAILMVAVTGEVLYEKNAYNKMPMASTTKIMTSLLAIESGRLNEEITVTKDMVTVEGTSMGLIPDDKISVEELVYGMLLESGNDAANTTSYVVSGSINDFVVLMNEKAKQIGMQNTSFATPSGLDADNHYSTAYDMALLGSYAVKNPTFQKMCSSYSVFVDYGNPPYRRCLTNHNKLLKYYDGALGIKTGFTKKSGRCLVSAAERNGVMLICVTLNAPNDWNDHKKLFDYGFENIKEFVVDTSTYNYSVNVVGADVKTISAGYYTKPVVYGFNLDIEYEKRIRLEKFLYPPVKVGDIVGTAEYYDKNGILIFDIPIVATTSANSNTIVDSVDIQDSLFEKIINKISG